MAEKQFTVHIVSHTHWDREWHTPFEGFRRRLVRLVDRLLDIMENDPRYRHFVLDGHTALVEDYLAIRPENRGRIEKLVKEGRLHMGPWYVLADEWLVSAEALVRNLLLGHGVAESFGRVMKAGYTPDPFGHISQLPQILNGFGLDTCLFMRGMTDKAWEQVGQKNEFWWRAPDGSRVLVAHLKNSYCNAVNLGWQGGLWDEDRTPDMAIAEEQARRQIETLAPHATSRFLLFCNGCDHVEPQPELPEIIDHLNQAIEEAEFVHSTFEDFMAAVREASGDRLAEVEGEFDGGLFHIRLSGTLSTRMYLKLANERCQALLERYAEPLQAAKWLAGEPCESAFLRYAWKLVLQNHPHDSICGCSVDAVHREMIYRFAKAEQVAELMAAEGARTAAKCLRLPAPEEGVEERTIVVFNPLSWERSEVVTAEILHALPPGPPPPEVEVLDGEGNRVPAQLSATEISEWQNGVPSDRRAWKLAVSFQARVPSVGVQAYRVRFVRRAERVETDLDVDEETATLRNAFLSASIMPDGSVYITDMETGAEIGPLGYFEDGEDAGDEYDWSPAPLGSKVVSLGRPARITLEESGPARAVFRVDQSLWVPAELTADRQRRSEQTVELPITTWVSLGADSRRVEFTTRVTNTAKDHRLRVVFVAPIYDIDRCDVMGHFHVLSRCLELPSGENWAQQPLPTHCTKGFVDISDGSVGLGVVVFGLPEYEVMSVDDGTAIAITLLRAVGWLSREDLLTRRAGNAGPKIPTPEAQCLGTYTFRYAVVPHSGTWADGRLWHQAEEIRAPLRALELPIGRGEGPSSSSLLSVSPEQVVLTALKKAERSDHLVVRLLNASPDPTTARVQFNIDVARAWLANLNEEQQSELAVADNAVELEIGQWKLATLLIEPKR